MSFLFGNGLRNSEQSSVGGVKNLTVASPITDSLHKDGNGQRPTLLDEKLRLHSRIIDDFNLTALEKLPREELVKEIHAYVANYVRSEKIFSIKKNSKTFPRKFLMR